MLGWEVFVYRHNEATKANLLARWKSSSFGVSWLDLLVKEGKAFDLGGSGYPCIYKAAARVILPVLIPNLRRKKFLPSSIASSAIFPRDYSGIVWNRENLRNCQPDEELLIYLYDLS
ncbi:MAG: hypothetical protein JNM09_22720 [Blastocatellia bacterium]|nr:hypothetical protein [Blastocatellia bacterium]